MGTNVERDRMKNALLGQFVTSKYRVHNLLWGDGPYHSSKHIGEIAHETMLFCIYITKADHANEINSMTLVMKPGHDRAMWVNPNHIKPFKKRS